MADGVANILANCGNNEDSSKLIQASNDTCEAVKDLVKNAKGALRLCNEEQGKKLTESVLSAAQQVSKFLEAVKSHRKQQTPGKNIVKEYF